MTRTRWALGGLALGAAWMYLSDPFSGRRRRALLRDKAVHASHAAQHASEIIARDLAHRSRGLYFRTLGRLRPARVDDARLEARIRAALGRVCSHPGAIHVSVHQGRVRLEGAILASEFRRAMALLRRVRGVREFEQSLVAYPSPHQHPELQGGQERRGWRPDLLQHHWAPATRFLAGLGAFSLIRWGLRRRDWLGRSATLSGLVLGLRGLTNLELRHLTGIGAGPEALRFHKDTTVHAPVEEVFGFWCAVENYPHFMRHVREVRLGPNGVTHWKLQGPAGTSFSWDTQVTRLVPHQVLAWRAVEGSSVGHAGIIHFEPANEGRSTRLDIRLSYTPPAGALGHVFARLLGVDPKRQMDEDLLRFKSLVETGRTTVHGEKVSREQLVSQPQPPLVH